MICSITLSGLEMLPDQKASQIRSIWLLMTPVIPLSSHCLLSVGRPCYHPFFNTATISPSSSASCPGSFLRKIPARLS